MVATKTRFGSESRGVRRQRGVVIPGTTADEQAATLLQVITAYAPKIVYVGDVTIPYL